VHVHVHVHVHVCAVYTMCMHMHMHMQHAVHMQCTCTSEPQLAILTYFTYSTHSYFRRLRQRIEGHVEAPLATA